MRIVSSIVLGTGMFSAWGLDLDETASYAYVADYNSGSLRVIDVRDKYNPIEVGSVTHEKLVGAAYPIYHNGYVYVEGKKVGGRFCVIDVTNPSMPKVVGATDVCCIPQKKRMISDNMVIGSRGSTVRIMDVSNPAKPVEKGSVSDSTRLDSTVGIAIADSKAYVSGYHRFNTIDISDPTKLEILATLTDYVHISGDTRDVEINGNYAFIADFGKGAIVVVDISQPTAPTFHSLFEDAKLRGLWDIEIVGTKLFCAADLANTLSIVDAADIKNLRIQESITDNVRLDGVMDIRVRGNYTYVTAIDVGRLTIIENTSTLVEITFDTRKEDGTVLTGVEVWIDGEKKGIT